MIKFKKSFLLLLISPIISTSLFAGWGIPFSTYLKVDEVKPLKETNVYENTIDNCVFEQEKERVFCTDNAIVINNHLSGKSKREIKEYYKLNGENIVYYDMEEDKCFSMVSKKVCNEKIQKDFLNKTYSYANYAEYKGNVYVEYSEEPLFFLNRKNSFTVK